MASEFLTQTLGEKESPTYVIKIQYTRGWGMMYHCMETIDWINKEMPDNQF